MVLSKFRFITIRQGAVESKIRQFLMRLEMVDGITLAHPFNSSFDKVHYCTTDDEAAQVATGEMIKHLRAESTDLQKTALAAEAGVHVPEDGEDAVLVTKTNITVYTSTFYIGLKISLKDGQILTPLSRHGIDYFFIEVTGETRKLDISWPSQEFYDICRNWPGYNEDNMNVLIKHVRKYVRLGQDSGHSNVCPRRAYCSFELPDDVFYDGQTRPAKPVKKIKKRVHASMNSSDSVLIPTRIPKLGSFNDTDIF
jgi:poly(A) polymerase